MRNAEAAIKVSAYAGLIHVIKFCPRLPAIGKPGKVITGAVRVRLKRQEADTDALVHGDVVGGKGCQG